MRTHLVVQVPIEVVLLPRQQPLLQQILVVAVAAGAQRDGGAVREVARARVDEHGHEGGELCIWGFGLVVVVFF